MQDVTIKEAPAEFPFSKSVQMLDLTDVRQRLKISSNLTEKEIIRAELESGKRQQSNSNDTHRIG